MIVTKVYCIRKELSLVVFHVLQSSLVQLVSFITSGCQYLRCLPRPFIHISSQIFNLIYMLSCDVSLVQLGSRYLSRIIILYFSQHWNLG